MTYRRKRRSRRLSPIHHLACLPDSLARRTPERSLTGKSGSGRKGLEATGETGDLGRRLVVDEERKSGAALESGDAVCAEKTGEWRREVWKSED
nr:hypothetical protein Iba_chr11fCG10690 [Ipomoea batatas]